VRILAIDFETGDRHADSAIAIGLVLVEDGRVAHRESHLIRPPRKEVRFTESTASRGGTLRTPATSPASGRASGRCSNRRISTPPTTPRSIVTCSAAPQAATTSCRPPRHWVCTVRLARTVWNVRPTRLPDVARHLCVTLDHHDALSDATPAPKLSRPPCRKATT
jgi:DNA polymerase-3 subunit epsilon